VGRRLTAWLARRTWSILVAVIFGLFWASAGSPSSLHDVALAQQPLGPLSGFGSPEPLSSPVASPEVIPGSSLLTLPPPSSQTSAALAVPSPSSQSSAALAGPSPTPTDVADYCMGDEHLTYVPEEPRIGSELIIAATSARLHPYPRLAGTERTAPQAQGRPGQLGYVWEWTVQPTYPGRQEYTFYVDSTIPCTKISFDVKNALATATPKPTKVPTPFGFNNGNVNNGGGFNTNPNTNPNNGFLTPTPTLIPITQPTPTPTPRR